MTCRTCVITVNYRGAADTAQCVASVRDSDVPAIMVVVDNTPDDPAIAAALSAYPEAHILRPRTNLGFGAGCNLGIQWALENTNCEFVFLLNNDATVKKNTISTLEGIMEEKADTGIVTPMVVFSENPGRLHCGCGLMDWRIGGGKTLGFGASAMSSQALMARYCSFAFGCAMFLRRTALERVGGFDEVFFMYEEDVDLSLRVLKNGFRIFYCPEATVMHRGQGSQRAGDSEFRGRWSGDNPNYQFLVYHATRGAVINARKHARGRNLLEFLAIYPLWTLWRATKASRKLGYRAFVPVLKGMRDGLRQPLDRPMGHLRA